GAALSRHYRSGRPRVRFNGSVAANRVRSTALGYALLAPSLFGVFTFLLLPMLVVFWLSLHRWDLLGPIRYVGLDNWQSVLTDRSFATSLVVTLAFIAMVVPAQTVLGLIAAAMLARGLPGTGFFRTLYVLPWICAPLAIAVLWRWILAYGRRGQHAARPPRRVAHRSWAGASDGVRGRRLDQRGL